MKRFSLLFVACFFYSTAASAVEPIHFVDVHVHYAPLEPGFAKSALSLEEGWFCIPIAEFITNLNDNGIDQVILEPAPSPIIRGEAEADFGIMRMAELHPERIFVMYGGEALTLMFRSVMERVDTPELERQFERLVRDALDSRKYVGIGEIGLFHMPTVTRGGPVIEADHPWMLKLADLAAEYGVPIDLHMEATNETVAGLERLLAHNRRAKVIWAHAGWSELGGSTAETWYRLFDRHPNLYGSIKLRGLGHPLTADTIAIFDRTGRIHDNWMRVFEVFPDRLMIGTDMKLGARIRKSSDFRHVGHMQNLLRRLPPDLLRRVTKDNAKRIFNLPNEE